MPPHRNLRRHSPRPSDRTTSPTGLPEADRICQIHPPRFGSTCRSPTDRRGSRKPLSKRNERLIGLSYCTRYRNPGDLSSANFSQRRPPPAQARKTNRSNTSLPHAREPIILSPSSTVIVPPTVRRKPFRPNAGSVGERRLVVPGETLMPCPCVLVRTAREGTTIRQCRSRSPAKHVPADCEWPTSISVGRLAALNAVRSIGFPSNRNRFHPPIRRPCTRWIPPGRYGSCGRRTGGYLAPFPNRLWTNGSLRGECRAMRPSACCLRVGLPDGLDRLACDARWDHGPGGPVIHEGRSHSGTDQYRSGTDLYRLCPGSPLTSLGSAPLNPPIRSGRTRLADRGPILGAHMSMAGGFDQAIVRGHEVGCRCVQVFTKNNNQWRCRAGSGGG